MPLVQDLSLDLTTCDEKRTLTIGEQFVDPVCKLAFVGGELIEQVLQASHFSLLRGEVTLCRRLLCQGTILLLGEMIEDACGYQY